MVRFARLANRRPDAIDCLRGFTTGTDWSPSTTEKKTTRLRSIGSEIQMRSTICAAWITRAALGDFAPVFDPEGAYLYFLSARVFNPVYDKLHFDLGFPKGMRPYVVTLRKEVPTLFLRGLGKTSQTKEARPKSEIPEVII